MQNWNIKITTCKFLWSSPPFSFSLLLHGWNNEWLHKFSLLLLLDLISALFILLCPSNWPRETKCTFILEGQCPHRQLYKHSCHDINEVQQLKNSPITLLFYLISTVHSSANTYTQQDVTNKQKRQKQMTKEICRTSYQVHCMHISLLLIGDMALYNPIVIKK